MLPASLAPKTQATPPAQPQSRQVTLSSLYLGLNSPCGDTLDHGAAGPMPLVFTPRAPQPVPDAPVRRLVPPADERACYMDACVDLVFGHIKTRRPQFAAQIERACVFLNEDPKAVYSVLESLKRPKEAKEAHKQDDALRARALTVVLEAHAATFLQPAVQHIAAARQIPWTRMVQFAGSATLVSLKDVSFTGSLACATYLSAQIAAGGVATMKGAALMTQAKGLALATMGTAAAGVAGVATSIAGVYTVAELYDCVTAFRDVWDNNFGRDAYFLHQIVKHHALAHGQAPDPFCLHNNDGPGDGGWTNPVVRTAGWRKGWI